MQASSWMCLKKKGLETLVSSCLPWPTAACEIAVADNVFRISAKASFAFAIVVLLKTESSSTAKSRHQELSACIDIVEGEKTVLKYQTSWTLPAILEPFSRATSSRTLRNFACKRFTFICCWRTVRTARALGARRSYSVASCSANCLADAADAACWPAKWAGCASMSLTYFNSNLRRWQTPSMTKSSYFLLTCQKKWKTNISHSFQINFLNPNCARPENTNNIL